jgi:hypothetical protein
MDDTRQAEDRLRAEYVSLLPAMQRTLTALLTEVNHVLLPAILRLDSYEQILIKGRIKDSERAVDSLRRRQESRSFDPGEEYSLTALPDLIGIRVLAFSSEASSGCPTCPGTGASAFGLETRSHFEPRSRSTTDCIQVPRHVEFDRFLHFGIADRFLTHRPVLGG